MQIKEIGPREGVGASLAPALDPLLLNVNVSQSEKPSLDECRLGTVPINLPSIPVINL